MHFNHCLTKAIKDLGGNRVFISVRTNFFYLFYYKNLLFLFYLTTFQKTHDILSILNSILLKY